jgi:tRNA pseudouridine55 synthase
MDGALLLDKPVGLTSNAALQRAKRALGARKAGHAGTLDPLASGLLVLLFGEATKFAGPLLEAEKEYLATLKLGEKTATGDAEGAVLETRPVNVTGAQVEQALASFRGEIEQLPPMHSALKHGGVPLYKLARRGESVERRPRRVRIEELELLKLALPSVDVRVRCSKGTYVRTLAEDIGAVLGTGAHLSALRRTASGGFRLADAIDLPGLEALPAAGRKDRLLPLGALLVDLPRIELDAAAAARLRNGQAVRMAAQREGIAAVYGPGGGLIGLGRADADQLRPLRLTQVPEKG